MDYLNALNTLKDYYANLLIVQYNGKPKATATIRTLVDLIYTNMILMQIRDSFQLESAQISISNKNGTLGITNAVVNKFTLGKIINNTQGTYIFEFDGSDWLYQGEEITLSDYGIKVSGTPVEGDTVTVVYLPYMLGTSTSQTENAQLDIIGKWVGVSRDYIASDFWGKEFFAYPGYNRLTTNPISTSELQHGYSKYRTFNSEGRVLTYKDMRFSGTSLNNDDYRVVIGLKIIKNSINHTVGEIDNAIYEYFGGDVYTTWQAHEVTYNYPIEMATLMNVCLAKNVLPAPTGVKIKI